MTLNIVWALVVGVVSLALVLGVTALVKGVLANELSLEKAKLEHEVAMAQVNAGTNLQVRQAAYNEGRVHAYREAMTAWSD